MNSINNYPARNVSPSFGYMKVADNPETKAMIEKCSLKTLRSIKDAMDSLKTTEYLHGILKNDGDKLVLNVGVKDGFEFPNGSVYKKWLTQQVVKDDSTTPQPVTIVEEESDEKGFLKKLMKKAADALGIETKSDNVDSLEQSRVKMLNLSYKFVEELKYDGSFVVDGDKVTMQGLSHHPQLWGGVTTRNVDYLRLQKVDDASAESTEGLVEYKILPAFDHIDGTISSDKNEYGLDVINTLTSRLKLYDNKIANLAIRVLILKDSAPYIPYPTEEQKAERQAAKDAAEQLRLETEQKERRETIDYILNN